MIKIMNKKILILMFSVMSLFALSGCGSSSSVADVTPPPVETVKLVSIQVTPANVSVLVGTTGEYTAIGHYSDNTSADLTTEATWASSDDTIVSIDANGHGEALQAGTADITASYSDITSNIATVTVTIIDATLVSIQVTPANAYVVVDASEQYSAKAIFSDGTTKDVSAISTWNTSDKSIAFIDDKGTATGVSAGTVKLAATYTESGIEATGTANLEVLATDPVFSSLAIEGSDVVSLGLTAQLQAVATLSDGTTYDVNDKVDWTTSDPAIATVDAMGVVTGVAVGDVVLTATAKNDNTIVATHNMTVTEAALVSIQIERGYNVTTPQPISTLDVIITTEEYITAWGIYSDGSRHYVNTDTVWRSSDQQIASINFIVSSNVYGRDLGIATITAHYGGLEATITATVVLADGAPTLTAITLKTDDGTVVSGGTVDPIPVGFKTWVTAYGTYSDGTTNVNINRYVAYSSDKPDVAYVIDEIDSNIRGRSEGSAEITAEWQGVSASVTAPVIGLTSIVIRTGGGAINPPPGTDINITDPLTMTTGLQVYITAHGLYTDGIERYINADVFWRSDDDAIAQMDLLQRDSWVTGINAGTTQVSARLEGIEGRATVIVQ